MGSRLVPFYRSARLCRNSSSLIYSVHSARRSCVFPAAGAAPNFTRMTFIGLLPARCRSVSIFLFCASVQHMRFTSVLEIVFC